MSITEAEYIVTAQARKEIVWLKMLLEELKHKQEKITLFYDSQSALYLAKYPTFHSKTKHLPIQYHFVRETMEEGTIDMQKILANDNVTDYSDESNQLSESKFSIMQDIEEHEVHEAINEMKEKAIVDSFVNARIQTSAELRNWSSKMINYFEDRWGNV
uniref:Retrovirus-related Pol polyprotein from transposon TNT 1-94 n=1 Tax=Tanacetum cinerariifolium TaxID=118510 RepID=A0A699HS65_TANCI|nr:retrovirus-related Pol polyprotein from transposon TNT 1-94 [Tanacetum cinerariifolium]